MDFGHTAHLKNRLKAQLKRCVMIHVRQSTENRAIAIVTAIAELTAEIGVVLLGPRLTAKLLRHLADDLNRAYRATPPR